MNKYIKYNKFFKPHLKDFARFIIIKGNRKRNYLKAVFLNKKTKSDFADEIIKTYNLSVEDFNKLEDNFNLNDLRYMKKYSFDKKFKPETLNLKGW